MMTEKIRLSEELLFSILNALGQRKRLLVFEEIAHNQKTFEGLRRTLKISKGGLSKILSQFSANRLVAVRIENGHVRYELTPFGKEIHEFLHFCENILRERYYDIKTRKIVLSSRDFISLIERHGIKSLRKSLSDWKIILTPFSFEEIIEWLDSKIVKERRTKKLYEVENLLYEEDFIEVLENYRDIDRTSRIELYLKKHKKLSYEEAELIATAADQNAILASSNKKVIRAGNNLGIFSVKLSKLIDFVNEQKLIVSSHAKIEDSFIKNYFKVLANHSSMYVHSKPYAEPHITVPYIT